MQHNLRDPSRDRTHGRIYRVTCEGRPLLQPVKIAGEPIDKLLELLKQPEDRVRYRAKIELGGRDSDQVIAATRSMDLRSRQERSRLRAPFAGGLVGPPVSQCGERVRSEGSARVKGFPGSRRSRAGALLLARSRALCPG